MDQFAANMAGMKKINFLLALFGFFLLNTSHAGIQSGQPELPRNNYDEAGPGEIRRTIPDGALLISDDTAGVIDRVSYAQ